MLRLVKCEALGFPDARTTAQALPAGKRPDLMLLDINMPDVSGLDLLEFLRRRQEWKDLPILMLSTEAADVTVDMAMKLGADGYITKPVTIKELEKAMTAACRVIRKAFYRMAKGKPQSKKKYRPSTSQIIFVILTLVIVLSFVLSLFVKI